MYILIKSDWHQSCSLRRYEDLTEQRCAVVRWPNMKPAECFAKQINILVNCTESRIRGLTTAVAIPSAKLAINTYVRVHVHTTWAGINDRGRNPNATSNVQDELMNTCNNHFTRHNNRCTDCGFRTAVFLGSIRSAHLVALGTRPLLCTTFTLDYSQVASRCARLWHGPIRHGNLQTAHEREWTTAVAIPSAKLI